MAIRNVLVLFGGVSTEYLISLRSAYNIIGGLRRAGFTVLCTGITRSGDWLAYDGPDEAILDDSWEALAREQAVTRAGGPVRSPYEFVTQFHEKIPDVIFPAVHGINCEDGSLQGLLELTGIPYVGCGVLASASGMDKLRAKTLFKAARLPQCRYLAVSRTDVSRDPRRVAEKVAGRIGFPCFLKPNNGGSSVGTMRADDLDSLIRGLTLVSQYDREIIVEEFLTAREIEVAVIGNERPRTAVIGEVRPSADVAYYDYEAKYFKADGAAILLPADLPPEMEKRVRRLAIKAYRTLGCQGLARVDFFLTQADGRLYINEINTLPGFTPISIFPKAFAAAGVPLEDLLRKLCQYAAAARQSRIRQELI